MDGKDVGGGSPCLEEHLGRIFASLGHGMYVVDKDRRILMWNRASESILRWSRAEALGRDCRDFVGHLDDDGNQLCDSECPLVKSMEDARTVFAGIVWGLSADGDRIPVNVSCAPLFDENGELYGAVEVFSDATIEKEIDRLKTQMCSVVAHELRTPLTAMKGYLEMVLDGDAGEITDRQREFLGIVGSSIDRLSDLVNDLLDLEKLEGGRAVLHWEEVDLRRMVEEQTRMFKPVAAEKGLALKESLRETPPVQADHRLLQQLVSNLISNAVKYTSVGEVRVNLGTDDGMVVLSVADTGVGIPGDELGKIGERFFRASTAEGTGSRGSGLGLAITREIVEKHHGQMMVESKPGEGSTFTVLLPVDGPKAHDVQEVDR